MKYSFGRMRVEAKFTDEHDGYYVNKLEEDIGHYETSDEETAYYVPVEMATDVFFVDSNIKEKLELRRNGSYYQFFAPTAPSFVEINNSNLYLSSDPVPQLCARLIKPQLTVQPKNGWITSVAPLTIQLDTCTDENLKNLCLQTKLNWSIRSRGRMEQGKSRNQPIASPSVLTFLPEEMNHVEEKITANPAEFEGFFDMDIQYDIKGGYLCRYQGTPIEICSTEKLFDKITNNIWSYPQNQRTTSFEQSRLIYFIPILRGKFPLISLKKR